ncbi:FadR/GntR family transcriptional regulator [Novosphingobium sediminicola]|uniref:DNA-binding FadR family transcriptional regulator n=1 Tax=Novosphingobium sediminicola TaxID=563162 RepID=A0A7W6CT78_9SPHN|nr:DNA-binding FadR family transcriptional regulator [Novosphingobium sediminicola]
MKQKPVQEYQATERVDKALRIHGSIARDLGIAIVTGHYPPGHILSSEVNFAQQNNISRTAYREAIRILAAKGLVESKPKTGTRITDPSRWHMLDPDVLAWTFEGEPTQSFIDDLFELRMVIEPAAAELAARRRNGQQLAQMGHALEEMARHGLATAAGQAADQSFHSTLLSATRNASLISLASSIGAAVRWTTIYKQRKRKLPRDPVPDHRVLFDAIADADPAAARAAMVRLIELALEDIGLSI